jgi:hypothetical protein
MKATGNAVLEGIGFNVPLYRILAPVLSAVMMTVGCAQHPEESATRARYYWLCTSNGIILPDTSVEEDPLERLKALGFDCMYGLGGTGSAPVFIQGCQETLFQAREIVLRAFGNPAGHRTWHVTWPADSMNAENPREQLGGEKGPWTGIAGVRHRLTSTEHILGQLQRAGMATYFFFGATTDLVYVRSENATKAVELLRNAPLPGVELHPPRGC